MEELDGMATVIGQAACGFLSRNGHEAVGTLICADGNYSAGWKLIVAILVAGGMLFAWLAFGGRSGHKL